MANFTPSLKATQSDDGKTVTLVDTSNYGANDQGYTMSDFSTREFILVDAFGQAIQTLPLPVGETVVTFPMERDQWMDITLNLAGPATFTKLVRKPFDRLTILKQQQVSLKPCTDKTSFNQNLSRALFLMDAARRSAPVGNSVQFQKDMDAANVYLDLIAH